MTAMVLDLAGVWFQRLMPHLFLPVLVIAVATLWWKGWER